MKLLFVVSGVGKTGGASKQLAMTVNAMADYGHCCYVYIFNDTSYGQKFDKNVTVYANDNPTAKRWMQRFIVPYRVRQIIQTLQIEIVVGWRTNGGCYAVLGALGTSAITVFSERSDPYMEDSRLAHKLACYVDGGVFQTEKVKNFYQHIGTKAVVIPNPYKHIQMTDSIGWSQRKDKIVHVGRLVIKQKRQDLLLQAFRLILKEKPSYTLHLYGEGPDESEIQELSKDLGDRVIIHGPVTDINEKIRDAKLMLLSSDFEGIPNVVLEAFSIGIPVVSTDCSPGGVRILIQNGINGFVVPFRDVKELSQKAIELLSDKLIAEKFISNSYKMLDKFDPDKIFKQWNEYLTNLRMKHRKL